MGPPFCGDECRAERALGCGGIFPWGQQAGATVRKRRREGNARAAQWAARIERRYTIQRTIRWLKNRCQVGPTILFECPAQIPRSFLRSFSLWARPQAPFIELVNFGIFRHFLLSRARKLLLSLV